MKEMIYIEYMSPASCDGWSTQKKADGVHVGICHSVGFVVREDEDEVLFTQSYAEIEEEVKYQALLVIPQRAIVLRRTPIV